MKNKNNIKTIVKSKTLNKFLSLFLCFCIFVGIFSPSYINAAETISINVKQNPKLDIVLTTKVENEELLNFQQDLTNKLEEKGFYTNEMVFQVPEMETITTDTNTTSAKEIFNNWTLFPFNSGSAGGWSYVDTPDSTNLGGYIISTVNPSFETGFLDTQKGQVSNIELSSILHPGEVSQPVGYLIRWHPQSESSHYYNGYMVWVSGGNEGDTGARGIRYICLFKIEGSNLDYSKMPNPYTSSPVNLRSSGGKLYFYHDISDNGYNWYQDIVIGQRVQNTKDKNTAFTLLGYYQTRIPNYVNGTRVCAANDLLDLKVTAKKDKIQVLLDENVIIDVTDSSYETGYYGFWQSTSINPKFYNMKSKIEQITHKDYKEMLNTPTWREDAKHVIINVDNEVDETLVGSKYIGETLSKTINDNISFIQWGSDLNKDAMENFISQNNGNGLFLNTNNDNYATMVEKTANYIISLYETIEEDEYVVINTPTNLEVTPENLATDTSDIEYPNGKWIIHHNAKYFPNTMGQSEQSEQFMDDLNTNFVFDKPGEYKIYYGEDLVKTIYAHRQPIANFSLSINNDKTLNITNQSYDLDSNENKYGLGNGIKEVEWKWKNLKDEEWTIGTPTTTLVVGESYVVQLNVKDEQDVWGNPLAKYITLDTTVEVPPIAAFSFGNSTIFKNNELEIIDTSYDPVGNTLSTYEWTLKKGPTTISTSATPTLKFDSANLGAGDYSYTLVVTNSKGLKSEAYTKSFKVIEDTIAPSVMIEPTYSEWGDSSAINFEFMDSGSGFAKFRYTHGATQTPPSDNDASWSDWSTNDNSSLNISEDGVWYLHLQAYDNNNNLLTRTVGVYRIDTTNPIIDSVTIDDNSIKREIPIIVIGHDDTSGIKYYRFVNETNGEDSGYIESNVYNAKSNGVYTIYVKDKNNNEVSTQSEEITIVDRVAPNILSLKVDSNTSEWTQNIETTIRAEDGFAGMNTYSYSLVKVDENGLELVQNENNNKNPFLLNVYAKQNIAYNPLTIDMNTFDVNAYIWQENDTFNINENGTYNLYARDNANNVSGVQFTIGNIDTTAPTIEKIEKSNNEVTNQDITITIVGANDDQAGLHEKPYSYDNGTTWTSNNTYVVINNTNGEVNVLVRDAIENIATFTYSIDNIDKTLPSFEDLNISNNREEKKANITFSFSDDRELYGYVLKTNSSLPQDSEYITNFEIDNGIVSSEYEVSKNGIYYLFIKDKAGNIYPQKLQIDALVTGIDFSQDKVTEYQTIGEESNISFYNTKNQITNEGDFDTYVYVSQQSTFSVVIPKIIILDGQTGYADYQASVLGNIAGKETIGVIPNDSFEMKDSDGVKANIVANVSQGQTSFAYDEIINKTTTNGSISAPSITAGSWNGILNFNVLVQNNLNIKDSIASVSEDSFALQVDDSAINLK